MNKWYTECINFLNASEFFKNEIKNNNFNSKTAVQALFELKSLYDSYNFPEDPDYLLRFDKVLQVVNDNSASSWYPIWTIWLPYFCSQGRSEWNDMWKLADDCR